MLWGHCLHAQAERSSLGVHFQARAVLNVLGLWVSICLFVCLKVGFQHSLLLPSTWWKLMELWRNVVNDCRSGKQNQPTKQPHPTNQSKKCTLTKSWIWKCVSSGMRNVGWPVLVTSMKDMWYFYSRKPIWYSEWDLKKSTPKLVM